MNNTNNKRKRGRPQGGVSFVNATLQNLIEHYGANACIPVSRVWLENNKTNSKVLTAQPTQQSVVQPQNQPLVEMQLID